MSSSNPKQNNKQDAAPFALDGTEYEIDLGIMPSASPKSTKDAVRSPERAKKNTFFENDHLNGE